MKPLGGGRSVTEAVAPPCQRGYTSKKKSSKYAQMRSVCNRGKTKVNNSEHDIRRDRHTCKCQG